MDPSQTRTAHDAHDDRLGMNEPITRRDFVNASLVAGTGLWLRGRMPALGTAGDDWTGYGGVRDYARSNGNTYDVMTAAHTIRDGTFEHAVAGAVDIGETYDLVVVGGGISGLAAAVFFQKRAGGRCLVLENHPIFGGEAKRNEFVVDGQRVVAHQGSAMFPVPKKGGYVAGVYDLIGMDRRAFEYQRWRGPSPEMPLSQTPYDTIGPRRTNFGPSGYITQHR